MSGVLPLGVEQLVGGSAVESVRLELKAGWNAQTVGPQILETLCAFANDLQNLNGGYVVIGVAEREGVAVRPVQGLDPKELDAAQKWIRGNCNRITPAYMPVLSPERLDGKLVLVLWAPASDLRPHQAPGARVQGHRYFVRIGSETVEAKGEILTRLLQSTARVPFDDRRAFEATVADLRETRVREFLQDVKSELVNDADVPRVYRLMQITRSANGHEAPRNVALLFFSDTPERWFPGARIEVAEFADDAGGNTIEERSFRGPLHDQVRQCLAFLEQMSTRHLEKAHDRIETHGWVSYPSLALREAVVNAVYHRSYEDIAEPSKIYLYPNRIEVISYPGPVDGIDRKHLGGHQPLPPVPARNRRIGEFLKELRLAEGRGTGVPKIFRSMHENGSPEPVLDFDDHRTYFRVILPAHPEYVAFWALRDAAYLRATGDTQGALRRLTEALRSRPESALVAAALIREHAMLGDLGAARMAHDRFPREARGYAMVAAAMADAYLDARDQGAARKILDQMPSILSSDEAFDAAILERRAGRQREAHRLFMSAGDRVLADPRAAHEFGQTKMKLANDIPPRTRNRADREARVRLLREAEELLQRVVQMDVPAVRRGWAWYDLGRVRQRLRKPATDVLVAFERAVALCPDEHRFTEALRRAKGLS